MNHFSPVEVAHRFVRTLLKEGDLCVDATMGNGHDSVFLAQLVGTSGKVLGFDVQSSAIDNARKRMEVQGLSDRVVVCKRGHETLSFELQSLDWHSVQLVMFNLGYLPGSDKSIITNKETTLQALDASSQSLAKEGAISIIAYRGHAGGSAEYYAVQNWVDNLPEKDFFCLRYERWSNQRGQTPVFFWVRRR